ncbi:hypothetical protein [Pseudoalteromonas luteoviolacea]|uniref:Uncharacterized protein n=1 Tax=Pseudoalteromonas luteoviolacea H33 TaxID=1365251 RepID=A0A167GI14_9GAMM|nr:hypothetical protein [Pseudoalteromonas luteoviolacea]KZN55471.1 hypothetical protein N476_07015 [Pseudoalteromonas luteoviolacea H33]KZN74510.1 hypothetical protein N477_22285 [Pseudoalteromonas luteoviolacea H33-S]MBQ4878967.1 hypothetical protein [Pseudoalteromonas luteoviolacea]MBQ4908082.1 hypothetical protein [Pseudoalteromonas luteoviolacea]
MKLQLSKKNLKSLNSQKEVGVEQTPLIAAGVSHPPPTVFPVYPCVPRN